MNSSKKQLMVVAAVIIAFAVRPAFADLWIEVIKTVELEPGTTEIVQTFIIPFEDRLDVFGEITFIKTITVVEPIILTVSHDFIGDWETNTVHHYGFIYLEPLRFGYPADIEFGAVSTIDVDIVFMGSPVQFVEEIPLELLSTEDVFNMIPDRPTFQELRDSIVFDSGNSPAAWTPVLIVGDVNCDRVINLLDVNPFVVVLTSGVFDPKADINQDGVVNLLDVSGFIELLSGG